MNRIIPTGCETHQDIKYDGLMISQNIKTQISHVIIYFYCYIFCPQLFNIYTIHIKIIR